MRIEVTDWEEKPRAVNIDFEFGKILVNLTFSKKDLEHLHGIVVETLEAWVEEKKKEVKKEV